MNHLLAKDMDMEEMTDALKDLNHFKYDEFYAGHGITDDLIDGVPTYRAVIDSTSDSVCGQS